MSDKEFTPEMVQEEKLLNNAELQIINNNFALQKELELQAKLETKDITIFRLKKECLKYQMQLIDIEINKKEESIKDKSDRIKKEKEKHRNFSKQIAEKYELDEKWGFDPETGKLV